MVVSMTGFGKTTKQLSDKKITIEIKTLNSKGLDLNVRMPSIYKEKELHLRNILSKQLLRGKIDFVLYVENTDGTSSSSINNNVIEKYIEQLKNIEPTANRIELMKIVMQLPDVVKTEKQEINEDDWKEIENIIKKAITDNSNFRKSEGKSLQNDFYLRIANITNLLEEIKTIENERIKKIKNKLKSTIEELKTTVDENRFEQELIYYLEKLDITEEKVRLTNHLNYFIETMEDSTVAKGRKLGFITQEIGREINTMGSKANHAKMQKIVIKMKDELEKIKEQTLNVL